MRVVVCVRVAAERMEMTTVRTGRSDRYCADHKEDEEEERVTSPVQLTIFTSC